MHRKRAKVVGIVLVASIVATALIFATSAAAGSEAYVYEEVEGPKVMAEALADDCLVSNHDDAEDAPGTRFCGYPLYGASWVDHSEGALTVRDWTDWVDNRITVVMPDYTDGAMTVSDSQGLESEPRLSCTQATPSTAICPFWGDYGVPWDGSLVVRAKDGDDTITVRWHHTADVYGGRGDDTIKIRASNSWSNGHAYVSCGDGHDTIYADGDTSVGGDCEEVNYW